jgi:hypothetical protein
MRSPLRSLAVTTAAVAAMVLGLHAADPKNWKPDGVFKGSALTGWRVVGDADWSAQNGELIGKAKPGTNGGWLVMDKSFQDVQLYMSYKCTGECKSGVLLRAKKTADGGMQGVFASLAPGDTNYYSVTLDATGKETSREQLTNAAPAAAGAPRGGGGGAAAAPAAPPAGGQPAAGEGGRGGRGGRVGGGREGAPAAAPAPTAPPAPAAAGAPAQTPPAVARGQQVGSSGRGRPTLQAGNWNEMYVTIGSDNPTAAQPAAPIRVLSTFAPIAFALVDEKNSREYGAVALFVGGTGEVRFKDFAWRDAMNVAEPVEVVSNKFNIRRLSTIYYGWGATTSDVNKDNSLDVISGPFIWMGPNFTERRRYREGNIYNPENQFAPDMVNLSADFTGDGYADVLSAVSRRMYLHVNPRGESRRWDRYDVLPTISTEIALMKDLNKDGKMEIIFGQSAANGGYAWAAPDAADPTKAWERHSIWGQGQAVNGHGLGVGDVNSDGRLDLVVPTGWYEQPAGGIAVSPWAFHEAELSDPAVFGSGGGEMGVYDINGDGLTDVVAGNAHNWGINWFEQKKSASGEITFVRHNIAQDLSTGATNTGGVVFSESHAQRFADMDGDKIPDMITGKRYWSEAGNTLTHADSFGAPVLYIYRTVRDKAAPAARSSCPSSSITNQASARRSTWWTSTRTASWTLSRRRHLERMCSRAGQGGRRLRRPRSR